MHRSRQLDPAVSVQPGSMKLLVANEATNVNGDTRSATEVREAVEGRVPQRIEVDSQRANRVENLLAAFALTLAKDKDGDDSESGNPAQ